MKAGNYKYTDGSNFSFNYSDMNSANHKMQSGELIVVKNDALTRKIELVLNGVFADILSKKTINIKNMAISFTY